MNLECRGIYSGLSNFKCYMYRRLPQMIFLVKSMYYIEIVI